MNHKAQNQRRVSQGNDYRTHHTVNDQMNFWALKIKQQIFVSVQFIDNGPDVEVIWGQVFLTRGLHAKSICWELWPTYCVYLVNGLIY